MKKILIVDDDPSILYVVDLILTHNDFNVKTTSRWSTILKTIQTFIPDLILLDIDLDGADGGEICKNLKQLKENKELPVILFSAHKMPKKYIRECDAQGFINKPFKSNDLVKIINANLN